MTASSYIESVKHLPVSTANAKIEEICGVKYFFEHQNSSLKFKLSHRETPKEREEYGDWQTTMELAIKVCLLLKEEGADPKVIIEPTCGKGHFILAALQVFDNLEDIFGIEIQGSYLEELKLDLLQYYINNSHKRRVRIHLYHQNVFDFDFVSIKECLADRETLVLGNPPWVTNSKLGGFGSGNVPQKNNFKKLEGLDAITGKSNFDIAEYICRQMIMLLAGEDARLALLLKNSVVKNIVYGQQNGNLMIDSLYQYTIDAKKEFGVSVAASLLYLTMGDKTAKHCQVKNFYTNSNVSKYGWIDNHFVADADAYQKCRYIEGESPLIWWSGLKHDCAKVMELSFDGKQYLNGLNEIVEIEDDMIFPLLKSSDLKGEVITSVRKYVIVTQKSTSDDTDWIRSKYPKTYKYLLSHAEYFDNRGSRIYQGRPRFCIFGIGRYSFKPYKVVVSGLYKEPNFAVVSPIEDKVVMLDDTCYMLGFDNPNDALITQSVLKSIPVQTFIKSLLFVDAKRVINKELLMRIDLARALVHFNDETFSELELQQYATMLKDNMIPKQFTLF